MTRLDPDTAGVVARVGAGTALLALRRRHLNGDIVP